MTMRRMVTSIAAAGLLLGGCTTDPGSETSCQDQLDDDEDGLVDCVDPDCRTHPACGPTAQLCTARVEAEVSCGQVLASSTVGAQDGMRFYGCDLDRALAGPERVYRFVSPVSGDYTVRTSDGQVAVLTVAKTGCDPAECAGLGSEITFASSPDAPVYLVVDGDDAADFTLEIECPAGISGETQCGDQLDNDLDGLDDCQDSDCASAPWCEGADPSCQAEVALDCGTPTITGVQGTIDHYRYYRCGSDDFEAMPYPESIISFQAPHAGRYRFRLNGDGGSVHELVLLTDPEGGTCDRRWCDSIGPEAHWVMAAGEVIHLAVEGPPGAAWSVTAECPAPLEESSTCTSGGELGCAAPLTIPATTAGPTAYQCGDDEGDDGGFYGMQAVAHFTAAEFTDVSFAVSAMVGAGAKVADDAWIHVLLADQGAGCDATQCLDLSRNTRTTLQPGEAVFVVADSQLGDELGDVTFTSTCKDPLAPCGSGQPLGCTEELTVSPEVAEGGTSAYVCEGELITGFYGREAVVRFTADVERWVTLASDSGELIAVKGAGCDPSACVGIGPAVTAKLAPGETLYGIVELSTSAPEEATATIWAECHDLSALGECQPTAALSCGQAITVSTSETSLHDVYGCGDTVTGGLYGREAVASFTATEDTTLIVTLPDGVEGFLFTGETCALNACTDSGSVLRAVLQTGQTAWVVADAFSGDAGAGPAVEVTFETTCSSPYGECPAPSAVSCGQTLTVPLEVGSGQIDAYSCGPTGGSTFVGGLFGAEAAFAFTVPSALHVRFSSEDSDLFQFGSACDPKACVEGNDSLQLGLGPMDKGKTITIVADGYSSSHAAATVTVDCLDPSTLPGCTPDGTVGCGDSVVAAPAGPSEHASWVCGEDDAIFGTLDGPEVIRSFTATEDVVLTVAFASGTGMIVKEEEVGDGCSPSRCAEGPGNLLSRKVDAGETVHIVAESTLAEPLVQAAFTVTCAPPPPPPPLVPGLLCSPSAVVGCGDVVTLPIGPNSVSTYVCGGDTGVAGLDGGEVAAAFTAPSDVDVTISVSGGTGLLIGPGLSCDPGACVDWGDQVFESLSAGETVYAVVDTEASAPLDVVTLTVACVPSPEPPPPPPVEDQQCVPTVALACDSTHSVLAAPSQASQYLCAGDDAFEGMLGPEAVGSFTATEPTELTITLPDGVVGVLIPTIGGECLPAACLDSGSELFVAMSTGETVHVVVDSTVEDPLAATAMSVTCDPP